LVAKIEAGEFIDMGELLPDHVGITRPDDPGKASIQAMQSVRYPGVDKML